jgi:squalene-hopene/tetraprenyl-beta-curcumene cyclase
MSAAASAGESEQALQQTAARAASLLSALQTAEGFWPNRLEGGPYLDVLYGMGAWLLGRKDHPLQPPHAGPWAQRILALQNADGGFPLWPGGASDLRYGIEAYLGLRLAGVPASEPRLRALGRAIAASGGFRRSASRAWMQLFWAGAAGHRAFGGIAPEHFYFLDYSRWPLLARQELACGAAATITAYLRASAPALGSSNAPQLEEEPPPVQTPETGLPDSGVAGRLISYWARTAPRSLRDPVVFRAYDAMIAEALGWPVLPVALHAALAVQAAGGRGSDAQSRFERIISWLAPASPAEAPQPCDRSTRTAALALLALAGHAPQQIVDAARSALLDRFHPSAPPSHSRALRAGWPLSDLHPEPDTETTALALLSLRRTSAAEHAAVQEGAAAIAAAQQADGGWSSHPDELSSPDVTGVAVEALTACGHSAASEAIGRAVRFLEQTQHPEAWWRASRGICRLYGTAMALRGLRAAGFDEREAAVLRAGEWLRSIQNADGGWGEDPRTFEEPVFREAASTPAHTAWALLGLIAGGDAASESVRRGFAWLAANQDADGAWPPVAPAVPGVAYAPFLMDPLGAVLWPLLAIRERLGSTRRS